MTVKLKLVDLNKNFCTQLEKIFDGFNNVEIINDDFTKLEWNCIVYPSNSFGLKEEYITNDIINYFGDQLESRIENRILVDYQGEQPIGTSFIIRGAKNWLPSGNKFVAYTPVKRLLGNSINTDNIYLAMKAVLKAVSDFNYINNSTTIQYIVCPSLIPVTDESDFNRIGTQMRLAYENFNNKPTKITWEYAFQIQSEITSTFKS